MNETKTLRELQEADGPGEPVEVSPAHNPEPIAVAGQTIEVAFRRYAAAQQKPGWRSELRKRGMSRKQIEQIGRRQRQRMAAAQVQLDAAIRRDITRRTYGLQT
jgi:hypothetical protein